MTFKEYKKHYGINRDRFHLNIPSENINDLKGIEKFNKLKNLYLLKNEISDIEPLRNLVKLNGLNLSGNKIHDITPLSGLVNLNYLDLSGNPITNIDSLKNLNIRYLNLTYLKIEKLEVLLTLNSLLRLFILNKSNSEYCDYNEFTDVNLEGVELKNFLNYIKIQKRKRIIGSL